MAEIGASTIVVASSEQVSSDLAGETVLLSMKTAHYYGLADVGAHIWSLVQNPTSVSEICTMIAREYDVSPAQCQADVVRFLEELVTHGLVEVRSGP